MTGEVIINKHLLLTEIQEPKFLFSWVVYKTSPRSRMAETHPVMTTQMADHQKPHVLVFPYPSTGHVVPLLDLTRRLLSSGLYVTVLITPPNLHLLEPLLSSHPPPRLQSLLLTPPEAPPRPPHVTLPSRILSLHSLSPQILSWFGSHPNPPLALISDFFLGWTLHLARRLRIPRLVFCPSGALGISVYYSLWKHRPLPDGASIRLDRLPGSPEFNWWQLSHVYTGAVDSPHPDSDFFRDSMLANMDSWGTILNSFSELESDYVAHLKNETGPGRVWTVGPLLPSLEEPDWAETRTGPTSVPAQEVLAWLDRRRESSVVYVCFGSREELSEEQTAALETALGSCRAGFIWCPGRSGGGGASVGGDRGLVLRGWAPQLAILRHRAVGAFVTHCGWNSVLEAVSAGVGMVAWPMGADQFADANLLADELGLAVRVPCEGSGSRNVPDPDELARVIDGAVEGTRPDREDVRRMKALAADSVKEGGSSNRNFEDLVRCLKELNQ